MNGTRIEPPTSEEKEAGSLESLIGLSRRRASRGNQNS
jgi:hypothetical protein